MQKRRVCKKWQEAVKKTVVPAIQDSFRVGCSGGLKSYNAMRVMTTSLPNLQQITMDDLGWRNDHHKWSDGEDPDEEEAAKTANRISHDIEIISNFSKLRVLEISGEASLNGRYPVLFNSFPLLQLLCIHNCEYLKWDLEMLAGFPLLKELYCFERSWRDNYPNRLTGNISSLGVLKDTLERVDFSGCRNVQGNFIDLADFPHLKQLDLLHTGVTGDIRDVGEDDFLLLENLDLPETVFGGVGCELQRIADAPDLVRAIYFLRKRRPKLRTIHNCLALDSEVGKLSGDSPDRHENIPDPYGRFPDEIHFVEVGYRFGDNFLRLGYRWENSFGEACEVNWLDPEPDRESNDYEKYIENLRKTNNEVGLFKGFHQPPTEEEYNNILRDRIDEDDDDEEDEWW